MGWVDVSCPKVPKVYPNISIDEIHFITFNPWNYLFAVSRMKKTQGLDVDQTTFTIGSLSTVPAQVIRGLG